MDYKREFEYLQGLIRVYLTLTNPRQMTLKAELEEEIKKIINFF